MAANPQELLSEAKCYACMGPLTQGQLLRLALLRRALLALNPTAAVDPQSLINQTTCFACYGLSMAELFELALLDQISTSEGGGGGEIESGVILMWSGSEASIPAGWNLCDGSAGTPDLQDKFVIGAGNTYAVGDTGGSDTHDHNMPDSLGAGTDIINSSPTGDFTSTLNGSITSPASSLPPYFALCFIMKL